MDGTKRYGTQGPQGWTRGPGGAHVWAVADILHRVHIAARPERVFDLITTPEGVAVWWTEDCALTPRVGSEAVFRFVGGDVVFRMRIDELEPGRRVAWTCLGDYDEWNGTTLSWDLEPTEDAKTILNFAHRGWATTEREYPECNASWGNLLHMIKNHAEGKPVEVHPSGRGRS